MEIRHILAPTDFSEFSQQAIEYAFALAQTFGAKLSLLHVIEPPDLPGVGDLPPNLAKKILVNQERESQLALARLCPEAEAVHVDVARLVTIGNPYREIVQAAETQKVDLIVMATHGRTGFHHFIMGSVAERVVRAAPCGVLTMRPPAATVAARERHAPAERPELVSTLH